MTVITRDVRRAFTVALMFAAVVAGAQAAEGSPIAISTCYTGDCSVFTGSLIVTITDDTNDENNGTGDVKLVVDNRTNGFVDEFGLLYRGGMTGAPAIEAFRSTGTAHPPSLLLGGCQNDNSGQGLDVCFDFPNSQSMRLHPGESVTFFVDSTSAAFLASHFDARGGYAHIQGLPGGGSVKLVDTQYTNAVPEPASLVLLGSGLAAVAATRWRKKKREAERASGDVSAG
jgi:hypothetical protein